MKTTFYSLNGEDFDHPGTILDALDEDGRLIPGQTYWECDFQPIDLEKFSRPLATTVLEQITEAVFDLAGDDYADDIATKIAHKEESLGWVIAKWIKEALPLSILVPAGKSRECILTQEQVDAHNRTQAATVEAGEAVPEAQL